MWSVRFADSADLTAIHTLWQASFPTDTAQERDNFLSTVTLSEECLLLCEDSQPIAMGFFLPAMWQTYRMRYLYAACTLPTHRSRGAFAQLLNTAHDYWRQHECDAVFLSPAEPSLVDYYTRFGYQPTFFIRTASGNASDGDISITPLTSSEYLARRLSLLPPSAVVWEDRFLLQEVARSLVFTVEDGIAMARVDGERLLVTELLGVSESSCAVLAARCGVDNYVARLPALSGDCFGMVCPLSNGLINTEHGYMGIAMD